MIEKITRETTWTSNTDKDRIVHVKIKEMNNQHLANTIRFLNTENPTSEERQEIRRVMEEEAKRRGLTEEFLRMIYPYDPTREYEKYQEPVPRRQVSHEDRINAILGSCDG